MIPWEELRAQLAEGIARTYRRRGESFTSCRCGWPTRSEAGVCGVCISLVREAHKSIYEDR